MKHLLKFTEWQSITGKWHTGDVSSLGDKSNAWWHVPRMLDIPLTDYILLLRDKFNAYNFEYFSSSDLLLWDWKSYEDCHKFTLFVNREARKRNFLV